MHRSELNNIRVRGEKSKASLRIAKPPPHSFASLDRNLIACAVSISFAHFFVRFRPRYSVQYRAKWMQLERDLQRNMQK